MLHELSAGSTGFALPNQQREVFLSEPDHYSKPEKDQFRLTPDATGLMD
jgi:hypothetical protein